MNCFAIFHGDPCFPYTISTLLSSLILCNLNPLSTKLIDNAEPLRLRLKAKLKLKKDSDLLIDQIRAIDLKRFIEGLLLRCSDKFMETVYSAICEVVGMPDKFD